MTVKNMSHHPPLRRTPAADCRIAAYLSTVIFNGCFLVIEAHGGRCFRTPWPNSSNCRAEPSKVPAAAPRPRKRGLDPADNHPLTVHCQPKPTTPPLSTSTPTTLLLVGTNQRIADCLPATTTTSRPSKTLRLYVTVQMGQRLCCHWIQPKAVSTLEQLCETVMRSKLRVKRVPRRACRILSLDGQSVSQPLSAQCRGTEANDPW